MTGGPFDCSACGQTHPRGCTAHKDGERTVPCGNWPAKGGTVCRYHGGRAPQVAAAAAKRLAEREALLAVDTFGLPRAVDPHEALLEELHRTAGAVAWLGAVVADIDRKEVVWGLTMRKTGGDDHGTTHAAGVNTWVQLWQAERKHLVDVGKACVAAGIEERRIRLAESSGQLLANVVQSILGRLGLSTEQQELVSVVVPEEFRRVAELGAGLGGGAA